MQHCSSKENYALTCTRDVFTRCGLSRHHQLNRPRLGWRQPRLDGPLRAHKTVAQIFPYRSKPNTRSLERGSRSTFTIVIIPTEPSFDTLRQNACKRRHHSFTCRMQNLRLIIEMTHHYNFFLKFSLNFKSSMKTFFFQYNEQKRYLPPLKFINA